MLQYEIAGLKLDILYNRSNKFKRLKPFKSIFTSKPDIEIKFQQSDFIVLPKYPVLKSDRISWFSVASGEIVTTHAYLKDTGRVEYIIEAKRNWSDITVLHHDKANSVEKAFCSFLGSFIISNKVILHEGLVLHASSISCSGKGIAFTAPSGTGKSTHAAMWEKYYNASILNDDCPIIKFENNQAIIHGTPWSGSENIAIHSSSPLSAIVFLEQSTQNSLHELTNEKAIPLLLPRLFLPYQDATLMDTALQLADKLICSVPKYLLKCKPDREAVELVHRCIM